MNQELFNQVKEAKSPEELKGIMISNGIEDFSDAAAQKYFDYLNMDSGEISDEELEQAAGGCKKGGRTVVTVLNSCNHWRCDACNFDLKPQRPSKVGLDPRASYLPEEALQGCQGIGIADFDDPAYHRHHCNCCYYCSYEGGMWYCNNAIHNS